MRKLIANVEGKREEFIFGDIINYLDLGRFNVAPAKANDTFMLCSECFNFSKLEMYLNRINDYLGTQYKLDELDNIELPEQTSMRFEEDLEFLQLGNWLNNLLRKSDSDELYIEYSNRDFKDISVYGAICDSEYLVTDNFKCTNSIDIEEDFIFISLEDGDETYLFEISCEKIKKISLDRWGEFKLKAENGFSFNFIPLKRMR
ncbi:hypothetical protein A9K75_08635 [Campylobacter fetus subsp. testudinum]|uniref:hypothetical protein n=1 Tax=Campylobacter fetus TaxID=196 RepID=UPI0008187EBF|nr:hypothetical protein [Campylobacter fetus]OCR99068.1 hypothetical protein A9K75_08635 [Campylobacter fetus subsp. testudinum]